MTIDELLKNVDSYNRQAQRISAALKIATDELSKHVDRPGVLEVLKQMHAIVTDE